jgi:hypothetical protein
MLLALEDREQSEYLSHSSIQDNDSQRDQQRYGSKSYVLSLPGITVVRLGSNYVEYRLIFAVASHVVAVAGFCRIVYGEGDTGKKYSTVDLVVVG